MVEVDILVESSRCFGMRVEQPINDRETTYQLGFASMVVSLHLDMVLLPDLQIGLDIMGRSTLYHRVDLRWQLPDC
jgi:hypothetical protein